MLKFNRRESFHNLLLMYNPQSLSVQFFFLLLPGISVRFGKNQSYFETGIPKSVWVGICQYSKLGSPRIGLGFILIWGLTSVLWHLQKWLKLHVKLTATATCSQKLQIFIVGGWCYYTEGGRMTTASDESGRQMTGRHSSKINKSGL